MPETFKVPASKKIQNKDLPVFTRLLGAMLDAGMPLVPLIEEKVNTFIKVNQRKLLDPYEKDDE